MKPWGSDISADGAVKVLVDLVNIWALYVQGKVQASRWLGLSAPWIHSLAKLPGICYW